MSGRLRIRFRKLLPLLAGAAVVACILAASFFLRQSPHLTYKNRAEESACTKGITKVEIRLPDGSYLDTPNRVITSTSFTCLMTVSQTTALWDKLNVCSVKINGAWPVNCPWDQAAPQIVDGGVSKSKFNCDLGAYNLKPGDKLEAVGARTVGDCASAIAWDNTSRFMAGPVFYYQSVVSSSSSSSSSGASSSVSSGSSSSGCADVPAAPAHLAPTGTVTTTGSTVLSWDKPAGAARFGLRIDDQGTAGEDSWPYDAGCTPANAQHPTDVCNNSIPSNFYTYTLQAGHRYAWWVHAINTTSDDACTKWSNAGRGYFEVPAASSSSSSAASSGSSSSGSSSSGGTSSSSSSSASSQSSSSSGPVTSVILNVYAGTRTSCSLVCGNNGGKTCVGVGTDAGATNGKFMDKNSLGCQEFAGTCQTNMGAPEYTGTCTLNGQTHDAQWTNCLCSTDISSSSSSTSVSSSSSTSSGSSSSASQSASGTLTLIVSARMQGVAKMPASGRSPLPFTVTVNGKDGKKYTNTVSFAADAAGKWIGNGSFPAPPDADYSVFIKGPLQLGRKVCSNNPTETTPGGYKCGGNFMKLTGSTNLDIGGIYLPAGDAAPQNGMIDSYDLTFVRTHLGSRDAMVLTQADVNADGVVDTQDYSLILSNLATGVKYDDE